MNLLLNCNHIQVMLMFDCMEFFRPAREFFTHLKTSPLPVKGCKFWRLPRHLWPLCNEGSLSCQIYCDKGHPFLMAILRNTHTYCRAFGSGAVITCYNELGLSRLGFEHQLSACEANTETHCATAAAQNYLSFQLRWAKIMFLPVPCKVYVYDFFKGGGGFYKRNS